MSHRPYHAKPAPHSEDAQPNEGVESRRGVPLIVSRAPVRQRDAGWAGRGGGGRGASPTNVRGRGGRGWGGASARSPGMPMSPPSSQSAERTMTMPEVWLSQGRRASQSPIRSPREAKASSCAHPSASSSAASSTVLARKDASPKLPSPPFTPETTPNLHPGLLSEVERAAKRKASLDLIRAEAAKRRKLGGLSPLPAPLVVVKEEASPLSVRVKEEPVGSVLQPPASVKQEQESVNLPSEALLPSASPPRETQVTIKPDPEPVPVQPDSSCPAIPCVPSEPESRLTTSGSVRVHPIPDSCLKTSAHWKRNREKWVKSEVAKVLKKGKNVRFERALLRDDGLVIDWISLTPVRSETLLPPSPGPPARPATQPTPADPQPYSTSSSPRLPEPRQSSISPPPKHAPHRLHLPRRSSSPMPSSPSPFTLSQAPSVPPRQHSRGRLSLGELRAAVRARREMEREVVVIDEDDGQAGEDSGKGSRSLSKVPEPLSTAIVSPRQPAGGASQDLRVVTTASHLPGSDLDNYAQTGSSASDPIASAPVPTESTVPSSDDESWEDVMQVEGELVYFEEQATLSTRADWADDRAGSAVDTPCLETTVLQPQDKEKDIDVYAGAVASDAPALDAVADNMDLQPGAPVPTQMSEPGSATNAGHLQASTDPPAPDVRPLREEGAIRDLPHEIMRLAEEFITQYVRLFDSDRSALASAYASNALFSYRINPSLRRTTGKYPPFASTAGSRDVLGSNALTALHTSRLDILDTLLSFNDSYKFIADGEAVDMSSDTTCIRMGAGAEGESSDVVLIVCDTTLRYCGVQRSPSRRGDGDIGIDMTFALRRKEVGGADRDTSGLWPLVVVSHQMTVRDLSS